jgi:hypothetical protein
MPLLATGPRGRRGHSSSRPYEHPSAQRCNGTSHQTSLSRRYRGYLGVDVLRTAAEPPTAAPTLPSRNRRAAGYDPFMATALARRRVTAGDLEAALAEAWSRETSADPAGWSHENPAWGQCAVTALLVQDYLGGILRRGRVSEISHYWNVLPSGEEIDLTRHQFPDDVQIENVELRTREYVLSYPESARRYRKLSRAVRRHLALTSRSR